MKSSTIRTSLLALALAMPLAACGPSDHADSGTAAGVPGAMKQADTQASPSMIAAEVRKGIDQAKLELATKDIDIDHVHVGHGDHAGRSDLPKAAITPRGDLVIAGTTVQATPEQHALLIDYRRQIIGIADAGMDIGARGAELGGQAAKVAIWGALTGKSDKDIEARIKPQTQQIEAAAMKLCTRMPDLLAAQQKLAAAMQAFRPYATMTQKDVDDCGKDADQNGKKGAAVFSD